MIPNCRHCASFQKKKKRCQLYFVPIEDPKNTTCIHYLPTPKKKLSVAFYFGLIAALGLIGGTLVNFFVK